MGTDIRLLPFYSETADFSQSILDLCRDYDLFDKIKMIETEHGKSVPPGFYSFSGKSDSGDTCYGPTPKCPYGTAVMSVRAKYLKRINVDSCGFRTRASFAYIQECPDDLEIAIYWH